MTNVAQTIGKWTLEAAFPEIYNKSYKFRNIDNLFGSDTGSDTGSNTGEEIPEPIKISLFGDDSPRSKIKYQQDIAEVRGGLIKINALMELTYSAIQEQISIQDRSLTLLEQILDKTGSISKNTSPDLSSHHIWENKTASSIPNKTSSTVASIASTRTAEATMPDFHVDHSGPLAATLGMASVSNMINKNYNETSAQHYTQTSGVKEAEQRKIGGENSINMSADAIQFLAKTITFDIDRMIINADQIIGQGSLAGAESIAGAGSGSGTGAGSISDLLSGLRNHGGRGGHGGRSGDRTQTEPKKVLPPEIQKLFTDLAKGPLTAEETKMLEKFNGDQLKEMGIEGSIDKVAGKITYKMMPKNEIDEANEKKGNFIKALAQIESSNRNIYSGVDHDYPGQPNSRSQGYFQIDSPTWREFAKKVPGASQYLNAMNAPRDVQEQVVRMIPLHRFGPNTKRLLQEQFGPLDLSETVGKIARRFNGSIDDARLRYFGKEETNENPNSNLNPNTNIIDDTSKGPGENRGPLEKVKGVVWHHAASRSVDAIENTLNQRNLGVQYIMDRQGNIHRFLPENARGAHILDTNNFPKSPRQDLNNSDTIGIEVAAMNDEDVTDAQIKSGIEFSKFLVKKYGLKYTDIFGHGQLNPGHKQADEGKSITDAARKAIEQGNFVPELTPHEKLVEHNRKLLHREHAHINPYAGHGLFPTTNTNDHPSADKILKAIQHDKNTKPAEKLPEQTPVPVPPLPQQKPEPVIKKLPELPKPVPPPFISPDQGMNTGVPHNQFAENSSLHHHHTSHEDTPEGDKKPKIVSLHKHKHYFKYIFDKNSDKDSKSIEIA